VSKLCDQWNADACDITIDPPNLKRVGDFFIVTGTATNKINCTLPHVMLRLMMHYKDPEREPMLQDTFHVTDCALQPGESFKFKIEGEYEDEMDYVSIDVRPSDRSILPDTDQEESPIDSSVELPVLSPINDWQEKLSFAGKEAIIQRGDIVLIAGENIDDLADLMASVVTMVTRSIYYHAIVYDHDWNFIHAFATEVFRDNIENFFFKRTNVTLTWLRPKHLDNSAATEDETQEVIEFATEQLGKPYDLLANVAFLLRADGLPGIPEFIQKLFQNRNWLHDKGKWHCSELAGASWYNTCGVQFVVDMKSKTYLSPADIYDSLFQDVVCTLKIVNGEFEMLTKQPD
jgi:hypothetical protein